MVKTRGQKRKSGSKSKDEQEASLDDEHRRRGVSQDQTSEGITNRKDDKENTQTSESEDEEQDYSFVSDLRNRRSNTNTGEPCPERFPTVSRSAESDFSETEEASDLDWEEGLISDVLSKAACLPNVNAQESTDDNAFEDSQVPPCDRKLVLLLAYREDSLSVNRFFSKSIRNEKVRNILESRYHLWKRDVTEDDGLETLISEVMSSELLENSGTNRTLSRLITQYPLHVMGFARGAYRVYNSCSDRVISTPTHLLSALEASLASLMYDLQEEFREETDRQLRKEQEDAFQKALALDKQREEEKQKKKLEKKRKRQKKKKRKETRLAAWKSRMEAAKQRLPSEPTPLTNKDKGSVVIKIHTPDGQMERGFPLSGTVENILDFILSKGWNTSRFSLVLKMKFEPYDHTLESEEEMKAAEVAIRQAMQPDNQLGKQQGDPQHQQPDRSVYQQQDNSQEEHVQQQQQQSDQQNQQQHLSYSQQESCSQIQQHEIPSDQPLHEDVEMTSESEDP